jgi:hypothetical protein
MSFTFNQGKQFQICTEGSHAAILAAIVDVGIVESEYAGETKSRDMMRFIWIVDEVDDETGEPILVFQSLTKSTHEKAKFTAVYKGLTGELPKENFSFDDLVALLGKQATLAIIHNTKGDRTYANVASASKPMKNATVVEIPDDWQPPKQRDGEGETYTLASVAATSAGTPVSA